MTEMIESFDTSARIAVLENEVKNISSDLRELRIEQKEQHAALMNKFNEIEDRLTTLEKWRWMVVGGAGAVGFVVSHMFK